MAPGRIAAAGFFISCHSLCRQQALDGALANHPASRLAGQSIPGSVLCAFAVLLRRDFSCRARNTFAPVATVGFDCYLFDWPLCGGYIIRAFPHSAWRPHERNEDVVVLS